MARTAPTTIRMEPELTREVDALARVEVRSRAQQIEALVREALAARAERASVRRG